MDEADNWSVDEALGWIEFCCWSALAMAPLIYWLQGPSVSKDQFVVRIGLVVMAAIGGGSLRAHKRFRRCRPARTADRIPKSDG
jgi:hypothetical protein